MPKAEVTIRRKGFTDTYQVEIIIAPEQAQRPQDAGRQVVRDMTRAQLEQAMQVWRNVGYALEWQVGGFYE